MCESVGGSHDPLRIKWHRRRRQFTYSVQQTDSDDDLSSPSNDNYFGKQTNEK